MLDRSILDLLGTTLTSLEAPWRGSAECYCTVSILISMWNAFLEYFKLENYSLQLNKSLIQQVRFIRSARAVDLLRRFGSLYRFGQVGSQPFRNRLVDRFIGFGLGSNDQTLGAKPLRARAAPRRPPPAARPTRWRA